VRNAASWLAAAASLLYNSCNDCTNQAPPQQLALFLLAVCLKNLKKN